MSTTTTMHYMQAMVTILLYGKHRYMSGRKKSFIHL